MRGGVVMGAPGREAGGRGGMDPGLAMGAEGWTNDGRATGGTGPAGGVLGGIMGARRGIGAAGGTRRDGADTGTAS